MTGRYRGPSGGPGVAYAFEAHNVVEFTVQPGGDPTTAAWAIHGPSPFMGTLVGLFREMGRMVVKNFEARLAGLERQRETESDRCVGLMIPNGLGESSACRRPIRSSGGAIVRAGRLGL